MNLRILARRRIPAAVLTGVFAAILMAILVSGSPCPQALAVNVSKATKGLKYERLPSSYDKLPPAKRGGTLYQQLSGNPKVINRAKSKGDKGAPPAPDCIWGSRLYKQDHGGCFQHP